MLGATRGFGALVRNVWSRADETVVRRWLAVALLGCTGALLWLGLRPWSATSIRVGTWKPSATETTVSPRPDDVVLEQRVQCLSILRGQPEHPEFLPPLQFFALVGYAGWDAAETIETNPCTEGLLSKRLAWGLGAVVLVAGGWLVLRDRHKGTTREVAAISNVSTRVDEMPSRVNRG
jgi:hypothetical protein